MFQFKELEKTKIIKDMFSIRSNCGSMTIRKTTENTWDVSGPGDSYCYPPDCGPGLTVPLCQVEAFLNNLNDLIDGKPINVDLSVSEATGPNKRQKGTTTKKVRGAKPGQKLYLGPVRPKNNLSGLSSQAPSLSPRHWLTHLPTATCLHCASRCRQQGQQRRQEQPGQQKQWEAAP